MRFLEVPFRKEAGRLLFDFTLNTTPIAEIICGTKLPSLGQAVNSWYQERLLLLCKEEVIKNAEQILVERPC